jgi:beta-barrel assembly-enhancing protease
MRPRFRSFVLGWAALSIAAAPPPVAPPSVTAGPGYLPQDKDERGLWMQTEEYERELKNSAFVMHDAGLNGYVRSVFCKTVGATECKGVRIYVVRTPYFNASMAPNGMMQIYSGLFLRVRDEAQFAAILGHEYTHYKHRHSIIGFRDAQKKLGTAAWFAGFGLIGSFILLGAVGSVYSFTRDMEADADAGSVPMMVHAGYDAHAASAVWEQLRAEQDATALARGKTSRKDKDRGMFQTHPPTAERMATLKGLADVSRPEGPVSVHQSEYRTALAPYWADFVDDQVKLNDFGATDFLLENLARQGWTSDLLYARGELYRARGRADDLPKAAEFYRQSIAAQTAPIEAWRGLGLALLRSGAKAEGQSALKDYLGKRPDASDRAMIAMLAGVS